MEPQPTNNKLPIILAAGISAIVFGLGGYLIANMATKDTDTTTTTTSTGTSTATTSTATPTVKATTTTSSTVDTKDWKTYTSSKYKFSFKYPSDWIADGTIESFTDESKDSITIYKNKDKKDSPRLTIKLASGHEGPITEINYDAKYVDGKMTVNNRQIGEPVKFMDVTIQPNEDSVNFWAFELVKLSNFQTGEGIESFDITGYDISSTNDEDTLVAIVSSMKF